SSRLVGDAGSPYRCASRLARAAAVSGTPIQVPSSCRAACCRQPPRTIAAPSHTRHHRLFLRREWGAFALSWIIKFTKFLLTVVDPEKQYVAGDPPGTGWVLGKLAIVSVDACRTNG